MSFVIIAIMKMLGNLQENIGGGDFLASFWKSFLKAYFN